MTTSRVEDAVRHTLDAGLIRPGERVAVAVSGGADSVALAHALSALAEEYGLRLLLCHYNHRLRGAESDRDEAFVRDYARALGLPCAVGSGDVAGQARRLGLSCEEAGRQMRYAFLRAQGCDRIATAHTLSDRAETMLFNLARGTGVRGLYALSRSRGEIVRPLYDCSREDIEDYDARHGLPFVTDSTNLDETAPRNRIRRRVLPELAQINPALLSSMAGLMARLEAEHGYVTAQADEAAARVGTPDGYRRAELLALPEPLPQELMLRLLERNGAQPSAAAVARMLDAARAGRGGMELKSGVFFEADGDCVRVHERAPVPPPFPPLCVELPAPGETRVLPFAPGRSLKVAYLHNLGGKFTENFHIGLLKNCVDCDRIKDTIVLRARLPGDSLRPAGRGCTKTLKKLENEAGIPPERRPLLAVLADGGGVIWAEGFGTDESRLPGPGARAAVKLEIVEE